MNYCQRICSGIPVIQFLKCGFSLKATSFFAANEASFANLKECSLGVSVLVSRYDRDFSFSVLFCHSAEYDSRKKISKLTAESEKIFRERDNDEVELSSLLHK